MLRLRRTKHTAHMNGEFRRYGLYALGEIALVIVGILIALQIDAWYADREARQRLDESLASIAADIKSDIERMEKLKRIRLETAFRAKVVLFNLAPARDADTLYDEESVRSASRSINASRKQHYFVANMGAYRALERSGLMNLEHDERLKSLLFDYYRTVDRIASLETDLNNMLRELSMTYEAKAAENLHANWLGDPVILWQEDPNEYPEVLVDRRTYGEVLSSGATKALLKAVASQPLFQEYEHLLTAGRALLQVLESGDSEVAPGDVYQAGNDIGFAVIIENGMPALHSLGFFTAPPCSPGPNCFNASPSHVQLDDSALRLNYAGGQEWSFAYAVLGGIDISVDRFGRDYSGFDRIQLELKRFDDCPNVDLVLKDVDDPDDGTQKNVPLTLSTEWQTHTIDLDQFVDADLSRLHVVTGFLWGEPPCHMAIRDVRFLKPNSP